MNTFYRFEENLEIKFLLNIQEKLLIIRQSTNHKMKSHQRKTFFTNIITLKKGLLNLRTKPQTFCQLHKKHIGKKSHTINF